ncbi:MAG: hypothetical protein ACK4UN_01155, partial [Limisphaerales bacterium]
ITDFSAELTFENPLFSTNGVVDDSSAMFFVRAPQLENITTASGGTIGATKKAVIRWFIIPQVRAGGTSPEGIRYRIGARLSGKFQGAEIPQDVLFVIPDTIFVKPEPQLEITYFQPRDVQGDDPFTEVVESPVPFTLGVLVKNSGYGVARNVKINSQQPRIVENQRNLLLVAQLLGTRVMDSVLQQADLLLNLGTIEPGQTRKGAWDMITSLSGEFVEFKASYTHASELGGEETSIIKSLNAHFIAHEVLNDQPGRDSIRDFLADTDRDPEQIPDALYESQGNILPVNYLTNAVVVGSAGGGGSFQVTLNSDRTGWGYMRLTDPGQSKFRLASVVRSDGKTLNTNNVWTNIRYQKGSNTKLTYLNIFDLVDLGQYTYTITYQPSAADTIPPVTTLHFSGPVSLIAGKHYITPETQMYFVAEDESPVSIVYSVTNSAFLPALPFRLQTPGEYPIVYYATDLAGNKEADKTATLVVTSEAPTFANVNIGSDTIFAPGDSVSIRPGSVGFQFQAQPNSSRVDASIDIFAGVVGWVTISNAPSSPTSETGATLQVAGDHVDYYKYRLNGGAWSAEFPIGQSISLQGLPIGTNSIVVLGRSQHGEYLNESNSVSVHWVVDPAAPATRIAGTPATPARNRNAQLTVQGGGVTDYRWSINNSFYRPETAVANPIVLQNLAHGQQLISVLGKINGQNQSSNQPTTVRWEIDPSYGSDFSSLPKVRSVNYTNIGTTVQTFSWDGRNDSGVLMSPGWYTLRVQMNDELGRTNFATRLVQIGELSGTPSLIADLERGAKKPHSRGRWSVWQDQSGGNWEIYAQDLSDSNAAAIQITSGVLNQENPQTDGRYIVWQSRQVNGNWDIWFKDVNSLGAPQALTNTQSEDEINPTIDWPWVVYQSRPVGATTAPWQLYARNLLTGSSFAVSPSSQDELSPSVHAGRVVWQDFRDVGPGEIYFKDLEKGREKRITTNSFGQYNPVIFDEWIAWQDNRNGQVDIYAYNLLRSAEVRITATPENEVRPYLEGAWLVCEEDSLGALTSNLRLIHLPSLRSVPLTRSLAQKTRPSLAANRVIWEETVQNQSRIVSAELAALQPVFQNRNAIAVTPAMATYQQTAFNLLSAWRSQGVQEITHYTSLVPEVVSQTAVLDGSTPTGTDFNLIPGSFLWVKFDNNRVLDLGMTSSSAVSLDAGINVFSFAQFPNQYTAYRLLQQLGFNNVRAVRMLDSESGLWAVAEARDGKLVGNNFKIPRVAVLMLDMANPVIEWKPE